MSVVDYANALADAALEVDKSWQRADHDYNIDRWARALATMELARERYVNARIALETNVRQEAVSESGPRKCEDPACSHRVIGVVRYCGGGSTCSCVDER